MDERRPNNGGQLRRPRAAGRPQGRLERFGHPVGQRQAPVGPGAEPLDIERAKAEVERFVDLALREMQFGDCSARSPSRKAKAAEIVVRFSGADEGLLLLEQNDARSLLSALEHVAHRWLRLDPRLHDRVRFDCADYRATHLEELKLSARVAAQRVRETGQEFQFNPMSSRERRIIHMELSGAAGVPYSMSEGMGDRRYLVIYPATVSNKK